MLIRAACFATVLMSLGSVPGFGAPAPPEESTPHELEARLVTALVEGKKNELEAVRRAVARLDPSRRADLDFRVDGNRIEFHFSGKFPFATTNLEMLEYIISREREKDHETLLSVREDEMRRLTKLRPLLRDGDKSRAWDAKFFWREGNTTRTASLEDVLVTERAANRLAFRKQLGVNASGLGGSMNVNGNPGVLPGKEVAAKVVLTFSLGD
jgi:hypothetical protein